MDRLRSFKRRRMPTTRITDETLKPEPHPLAHLYDISRFADDGRVTVSATPEAFARLTGRTCFGDARSAQMGLQDAIASAWYAAGCPRFPARGEDGD